MLFHKYPYLEKLPVVGYAETNEFARLHVPVNKYTHIFKKRVVTYEWNILFLSSRTTVTSAHIPEGDSHDRACNMRVF